MFSMRRIVQKKGGRVLHGIKRFPFVGAVLIAMLFLTVGALANTEQSTTADGDQFPGINEFVALDKMPELVYKEAPVYPRLAEKAGIEGKVYVKVLVDQEGLVQKAIVLKSSESVLLDESARVAALGNKYKPGVFKGKPVVCWVTYKVEFVM